MLNISGRIDKDTVSLCQVVKNAADKLDIPFVLVGASARDIILHHAHGVRIDRATVDVDIGIQVPDWSAFSELKNALVRSGFSATDIQHRLISPSNLKLDIVPFGNVQNSGTNICWPPDGEKIMNVLGFQEACDNAEKVRLQEEPPVDIPVATPAGLALLKIIAWTDRQYNQRKNDAMDLYYLIDTYESIPAINERIFSNENLMSNYGWDSKLAGAYLLGKDAKAIAAEETKRFVQDLFDVKIDKLNPELLVEDMCHRIDWEFERKNPLFEAFIDGFESSNP